MKELLIEIEPALALRDRGALMVDSRTPAEFAEATIPGAVNIPLFSDEERARVGTAYHREGAAAARMLSVDLVAPRIPQLVRAVLQARGTSNRAVIVFCWRGGERSRALTTFLRLAGVPARQLRGGHKGFRAHVRGFFQHSPAVRLLVLRGLTGVGKTRFLERLRERGHPVLNLEALANHRGSAFGGLGLRPQPSQKMFEALLWDAMRQLPPKGYVLTEGESRNIGKCQLPDAVYRALQVETSLWLEASLDTRVRRILEDYPAISAARDQFQAPILALRRRLGGEAVARLLDLLAREAWQELVRELMVLYYDPLYRHSQPQRRIEIEVDDEITGVARIEQAVAALLLNANPG